MRKNLKYILVILAVLLVPALVIFIASVGSFAGHFGPFQYLFAHDAFETWNPIVDFTGDMNKELWPAVSLFLPTWFQAVISIVLLVMAVILAYLNPDNQKVRVLCIVLAVITCIRHLLWRGLFTLDFENIANIIVGIFVYLAEITAFGAMLLGYFQMYKPTSTPKVELSNFPSQALPTVDVYITTYNEGTDILYRTIVCALNLDYEKKTVYILDDGHRPEVRELCSHLGCKYISRENNIHAKAGNMNNALKYTNGDLVLIIDADHSVKLNFLQETVGLFLKEEKLAYVQTPQHFYTPDPFQRNLIIEKSVTNEQDLFYQVIQPGNNYWGAAFFAGSGALFRRSALNSVGGFAVETITEDTHTGIRLHAKKFKSFYVNKILAAGLSQDSFVDYLNQRLRWGRGMFQILRHDNPLFVKGLRLVQRLCYFSGIYYFFHGLPRIVFLMAPLCFLAGGLKPINAGIVEMIIYYAPSFLITMITFSVVTKGIRQTFWSEVYETATALYLFIITTLAVIIPGRSKFRVTPKGSISSETKFDWITVFPQLILASLTIVGLILGLVRMLITPDYIGGILPNIFWATYNVFLMLGAIIVAFNRPQYRSVPRIFRKVRVELSLVDGTYAVGYTTNISETGLAIELESPVPVSDVVTLRITDTEVGLNTTLTARVIRSSLSRDNRHYLSLKLVNRTDEQHKSLVRNMFTAPSMWTGKHLYERKTSGSFYKMLTTIFRWGSKEEVPFYRVAPRFDKALTSVVILKDRTLMGTTAEVSETGAAVRVEGNPNVNIGDLLTLRIQWQDGTASDLNSEVARKLHGEKNMTVLGLKFTSLSIEQKLSIIKHLYQYSDELVRVAPHFERTLSCLVSKPGLANPIPSYTKEISETSIVIMTESVPFKENENVKLMLQWEDKEKQEINCKIVQISNEFNNIIVRLNYVEVSPKLRRDLIKRLYTKVEETPITTV